MKHLSGLIASLSLGLAAPLGAASPDPLDVSQPRIGGAEVVYLVADNNGIHSSPSSADFWYAGTSGVASD